MRFFTEFGFGFGLCVVLSALFCYFVLATRERHIHLTGDCSKSGPQKLHNNIVPRVGGVCLFLAVFLSSLVTYSFGSAASVTPLLVLLLLSPCALIGFAEDITKDVSAAKRYLVTMLAAAIACSVLGVSISSVDIPAVDGLLANDWLALGFAAFAIANVAHAFNLTDGQNGLCSGSAVIASLILAAVAWQVEELVILQLALLCAAGNFGFLLFNFPAGKIFLGDAGAYFNGALLALLTVWLVQNSAAVTPWFAINALLYPVWETLFTIIRRLRNQQSIAAPDALHLHSLIYRRAKIHRLPVLSRTSAPVFWFAYAAVGILAVLNYESAAVQMAISIAFVAGYTVAYWSVTSIKSTSINSRSKKRVKPRAIGTTSYVNK